MQKNLPAVQVKTPDAILGKDEKLPEPPSSVDITLSFVPYPVKVRKFRQRLGADKEKPVKSKRR